MEKLFGSSHNNTEDIILPKESTVKLGKTENYDGTREGIRNCFVLAYQCPKTWESLQETKDKNVKFCGSCGHNVYYVQDIEELERFRNEGKKCVMLNSQTNMGPDYNEIRFEKMGEAPPPRYFKH